MAERHSSLSDRVYASLLRLFPGDFRAEFAEEMQADFRDERLHAERTGGRAALTGLWIRTTLDIVRRAPAEQLDVTGRDVVYTLRLLRRNPLFATTAILTLAIAIGVNTTMFSIVDGMLFKPMPYHEPDRLVMVSSVLAASDRPSAFVPKLIAMTLREQHNGLGDFASIRAVVPLTLMGAARPESFRAAEVTSNLLTILGVNPVRGRSFTEDDVTGPQRAALVSHSAWIARFGADPSIVDRLLSFEEGRVRVVGVLPRTFIVPSLDATTVDLLLAGESTFRDPPTLDPGRELTPYAIARLEPGLTLTAAQAEADALVSHFLSEHPSIDMPIQRTRLMDLQVGLYQSRRLALLMLFAGATLVLVIACGNLANLLLARAAARDREMAVRSAMGASRFRLIRQLAIESTILALAGGAGGVLLARWTFDFAVKSVPPVFALLLPDAIDTRAMAFSALATGISILLFGAVPAIRGSQTDVLAGLHERRSIFVASRIYGGRLLIGAETVIVTVLVICAVLMVGSFGRLRSTALGFEPDTLISVKLTRRFVQSPRMREVLSAITSEMRNVPGVVSVAAEDVNPIGVYGWMSGQARFPDGKVLYAHRVTAGYFDTMGLRLVAGRLPAEGEWRGEPFPAVVTERAALALGGSQSALGKSLALSRGDARATVIGVVNDIRLRYDDVHSRQIVFLPPAPDRWSAPGLVVRTSGDPRVLHDQIRAILARAMPRAVPQIVPVRDQLDGSLALLRFQAQLLGTFGVIAVLLAIVGIHGVIAQMVAGRTREIGIRMALGATAGSVRRLVITQGVAPVVVGLLFGVVGGFWVVQVFKSYVHGVQLRDPVFFTAAALIVVSTALVGTWIPARHATRIDPAKTLRME